MLILTAILLSSCSLLKKSPDEVTVQKELRPIFEKFVEIVEKNNIEIDWTQINSVEALPLYVGVQGFYSSNSKTVAISHFYTFPMLVNLTDEEKRELLLLTLAHEVAHSQGFGHIDEGISLMNPSSIYHAAVVKSIGAEEFILSFFGDRE